MAIVRILFPALIAVIVLFSAVTHPTETFQFFGTIILALSTASSIVFFSFVLVSMTLGLGRHSTRHLAPAAAVHVHRSLRDDPVA